ncbi:MAG: triose-phosphate isomerase [Alphaproteobacteria bacterium]|nr:triose-phosphate isomerase [Alphaproteobacteria bacterium]
MADRRPMVAGNWKMNGRGKDGVALAAALATRAGGMPRAVELLVCPPATLIAMVGKALGATAIALGGQDCHVRPSGAFTGDVSAEMLADLGCRYVLTGHSERRAGHGEDDTTVRAKAEAAHRAGLTAIVCVGETQAERDSGRTLDVIRRQLAGSLPEGATAGNVVVAYEPVWAIGTGRTPTPGDVAGVHDAIRAALGTRFATAEAMRILYGGSVKAGNAAELMAVSNVDGALVGGASLDPDEFWAIAMSVSA